MAEAALKKTLATLEDLLAIPEGQRFHELLAGEIVQKAMPSIPHGDAQLRLGAFVQPIRRGGGGSGSGGWVFAAEAEIQVDRFNVVRPDVAGWRRERMPTSPRAFPCPVLPDWICEILSPSTARVDLWEKLGLYHAADGARRAVRSLRAEPGRSLRRRLRRSRARRLGPQGRT